MTEIDTKALEVLLRRIPSERVLRWICSGAWNPAVQSEGEEAFLQFAAGNLPEYSQDEHRLIFSRLREEAAGLIGGGAERKDLDLPTMTIGLLLSAARRLLTQAGEEPQCKVERVLEWRKAFHTLGQDVFVCAYLASEDLKHWVTRRDFTWRAVIRTNYAALNLQLQQGIAENHCHLFGSTQTFALSWCSLMNDPQALRELVKAFPHFLRPAMVRGPEDSLLTMQDRVRYAAFRRSYLFRRFCIRNGRRKDLCEQDGTRQDCRRDDGKGDQWTNFSGLAPELRAYKDIAILRAVYGAQVPQPEGGTACLDYALDHSTFHAAPNAPYRSLAGERRLLYCCFRACLEGQFTQKDRLVFFLYLQLKLQFRSEMIQVNGQVGFANFADYEVRKGELLGRNCYWVEATRMGLNGPLSMGSVTSLEARIGPKATPRELKRRIQEQDWYKEFADQENARARSRIRQEFGSPGIEPPLQERSYFYVLHFIKRPDIDPKDLPLVSRCRHEGLRRDVRRQALALARALSTSPYLRSRIRGVDAANNEVHCPPEVFAPAFRFLRNFKSQEFAKESMFLPPVSPRLSATYHVGEDFLDIASALRAIDETIEFLDYRRGDRLGHALGLGIAPEVHYAKKGSRIFMPKQQRLDDLVWLLYRGRELGTHIDPHMYGLLKKEAEILLLEIYGDVIRNNRWMITLTEYHCCMQLRGDDPSLYRDTKFSRSGLGYGPYDRYFLGRDEWDTYRKNPAMAGMYSYYHYGSEVKRRGAEVCEVTISPEYIRLMRQVQDVMQEHIERRGIAVECNPTSNVLIGTFETYEKHPIFRFYDSGLGVAADRQLCRQMEVCVNTDDLGIFDTSLEFEYALLFRTLDAQLDADGKKRYQTCDILRYLKNLQDLGMRAVFPCCDPGTPVEMRRERSYGGFYQGPEYH